MAARAGQGRLIGRLRIAPANGVDQAGQRAGQQQVEQAEQYQAEQQAADETVGQRDPGPAEEALAIDKGVDLQAQLAAGGGCGRQCAGEAAAFAEQPAAQLPAPAVIAGRALGTAQQAAGAIDQFDVEYRRRLRQAQQQFAGQRPIPLGERPAGRLMADRQNGTGIAVEGRVFAGIIEAHLEQAE
ncbi:hypothetical protein D3C78_1131000 [compost metagenome]